MATDSNVKWFGVIKIETIDSKTLTLFMCLLEKVVMETDSINLWKLVIILGNDKMFINLHKGSLKSFDV